MIRFAFELLRDFSGLVGAALTAAAFFRFEGRKAEAAALDPSVTTDPELRKEVERSRQTLLKVRVLAPSEADSAFTAWGFVLIAFSFLVSIGLTLTEVRSAESAHKAVPAISAPATAPATGAVGVRRG